MASESSLTISETSPYDPALAAFFSSTARTREHLLLARDAASGALIGVCEGATRSGGVYCSRLAIAKASRRAGVGRALLAALYAEARAATPPAAVAWLCTLDYQGPLYYPKVGYTPHHELAGLRDGRVSTYFFRTLDGASAAPPPSPPLAPPAFSIAPLPAQGAEEARAAALAFVRAEFDAHSREAVGGVSGYFALALEATRNGERVGALNAMSYWGLLVIKELEVAEGARRGGVGRALVQAAAAAAAARGCSVALAEALEESQAPRFWERAGFERLAELPGFENGERLVRLARRL